MIGHHTIWTPSPGIVPQLIYALPTGYIADPLNTFFLVVLPWMLQKYWGCTSQYICEVGASLHKESPLAHPALLQITVVLLHVAPHVCSLPISGWKYLPRPTFIDGGNKVCI